MADVRIAESSTGHGEQSLIETLQWLDTSDQGKPYAAPLGRYIQIPDALQVQLACSNQMDEYTYCLLCVSYTL